MLDKTTVLVTGLNALVALVPAPQATTPSHDAPLAAVNSASLTAIEKSWLQLPQMCKARNAAFDPVVVEKRELPPTVAAIYSQSVA